MGSRSRIRGGRASPRGARTCHKRRVYFRRWLEHVLGFVNGPAATGRGRDPSRRWARGHVFGEGARPRAPRGRAITKGVFSSAIRTRLGFVNDGSRGRDPSRRWARGHVFGEGARPRAPRGGAINEGCIFVGGQNTLGFVNGGSRGRDPSRRWAHGHVFGEGARPRAARGRGRTKGCFSSVVKTCAGLR